MNDAELKYAYRYAACCLRQFHRFGKRPFRRTELWERSNDVAHEAWYLIKRKRFKNLKRAIEHCANRNAVRPWIGSHDDAYNMARKFYFVPDDDKYVFPNRQCGGEMLRRSLEDLPPHLQKVAQLVSAGWRNKEIAKRLRLSEKVVATYKWRLRKKLCGGTRWYFLICQWLEN